MKPEQNSTGASCPCSTPAHGHEPATSNCPMSEEDHALEQGEVLSQERIAIAMDAAAETEQIASQLLRLANSEQQNDLEIYDLVARGLAIRVRDLASIIMSAIGDELDDVKDISTRLTGLREEAANG